MLGSGIALLDGTIVNVALPTIGRDLDADLAGLQWVVNAYALTLAAFILLGGSLGDRFGRRAMYAVGVAGFGVASALCALSPTVEVLVAARAVQGLCAALLVPGQPRDPAGVVPPGRPDGRDRRLDRPAGRRVGVRPGGRRLARRARLEVGLLAQRAAGGPGRRARP